VPKERAIANLSCCTGLTACTVHLVIATAVLKHLDPVDRPCHVIYSIDGCRARTAADLEVGIVFSTYCSDDCTSPAECYDSFVLGGSSGVYAEGSSICGAALRSGIIQEGAGGWVQVAIQGGRSEFAGVTSNGVSSWSVGSFGRSFRIEPFANSSCIASSPSPAAIRPPTTSAAP